MCAVAPGAISSAVKSTWKTASSVPNACVLSPVIGSSEDPGYSNLEPSPWICLSLMLFLCVFFHPWPMLSGFIPAQLASSFSRSWGQNREHSELIFALPPTWSSPSMGEDRPLSNTANCSITKWKGCLGKMGLAVARWGSREGCMFNMGSSLGGSGLSVELGGVDHSQTKVTVAGRWQICRPFPTCLSCLLFCKSVALCGAYTSPLLSPDLLWTQASDPNELLAMNAVDPWKAFRTANQK